MRAVWGVRRHGVRPRGMGIHCAPTTGHTDVHFTLAHGRRHGGQVQGDLGAQG